MQENMTPSSQNLEEMQNCFFKAAEDLLQKKDFRGLKELLSAKEPADIADFLADAADGTGEKNRKELLLLLFRILPKETAAEVFVALPSPICKVLVEAFTDSELGDVLSELFVDDTVGLIEEMPANVASRILKNADPDTRDAVNSLLCYPENSAGRLTTTEYVSLKPQDTVREAFELIRACAIDKETVYTCYVTENRKLLGVVSVRTLLVADPEEKLADLMETNVVSVGTHTDREEAGKLFEKYGFLALPVVDGENRLVGIITVDDAIDALREETEEDFAHMAAISTPPEDSYLRTSVFALWRARIPWLLILMISATFTGLIISSFESSLSACVVLTAFIPMLMDTGGNSGSQASVTVIRSLSLGDISFSDLPRVLAKEICVALLAAVTLFAAAFSKIMLIDFLLFHTLSLNEIPAVPLAVSLTLAVTVLCAKVIGATLPIFARKLGFDPAVMASPFITTIVDTLSLAVYFAIARTLIPGL